MIDFIVKHKKKFIIGLIIFIIGTPIILDKCIFDNNYVSKVTNDGWAGFLGGYIGALIGAIVTLAAVLIEMRRNDRIRKEDEIKKVLPSLSIKLDDIKQDIKDSNELNETIFYTDLTITNIGLNTAVSIKYSNFDEPQILEHFNGFTLMVGDSKKIENFKIPDNLIEKNDDEFSITKGIEFTFTDLLVNEYTQTFRVTGTYFDLDEIVTITFLIDQFAPIQKQKTL